MATSFVTSAACTKCLRRTLYVVRGAAPTTSPAKSRTEGPRGEVAEWSNVPHSKCGVPSRVPWVRIPPSPPRPATDIHRSTWPRSRYRAGVDSFLVSLDAQRVSYAAEQQLVATRLAGASNLVELYRSLGGGIE